MTPVGGVVDLTPEWCDAALAPRLDGARVVAVEVLPVGEGQVADTVRLRLAYEPAGAGPPTLVGKVPAADEASRRAAQLSRTYEIEASFYRQLAPTLAVRTPQCWAAAHEPTTGRYVVLLEDVAPAEAGDQLAGLSVAQAEAALDELALLHASRWGDPSLERLPWLHRSTPDAVAGTVALVTGCAPVFLERYGDRLAPPTVALVERLLPRLGRYLTDRPPPWTVVHGDFRADNLLFGAGRVVVVDWQTVILGAPASDVGYLLGTSLPSEVRRTEERTLVARYVERVRGAGATDAGGALSGAWTRYRRAAFTGLVMSVAASVLVRRTPRGDDMFCVMAERAATMAHDLDAEDLLAD